MPTDDTMNRFPPRKRIIEGKREVKYPLASGRELTAVNHCMQLVRARTHIFPLRLVMLPTCLR